MKTNGNDPAQPEVVTAPQFHKTGMMYGDTYSQGGLTKREHFAAMAMQGYMAYEFTPHQDPGHVADYAVNCADALIKALNEEEK